MIADLASQSDEGRRSTALEAERPERLLKRRTTRACKRVEARPAVRDALEYGHDTSGRRVLQQHLRHDGAIRVRT